MKLRFLVLILAVLLICAGCSDKIENFPNLDTYTGADTQPDSKETATDVVDGTVTENVSIEIDGGNTDEANDTDEVEVLPSQESVLTPEFVQNSIVGGYWVGAGFEYPGKYLITFNQDYSAELISITTSFSSFIGEELNGENTITINDSIIYGEYFIDEEDCSIVLKIPEYQGTGYYRLQYNTDDCCIHFNRFTAYAKYACDIKFIHFDSMPDKDQLFNHLGWSTNYMTYDVSFDKPVIGLQARLYDDRAFIRFVNETASSIYHFNVSNYYFNTVPHEMGAIGVEICDSRVSSLEDVEKYIRLYFSENIAVDLQRYYEENGKLYAHYGLIGSMLEDMNFVNARDVNYVSDSKVEVTGICSIAYPGESEMHYRDFTITLVLENGYWKFDSFVISSEFYSDAQSGELLKHKQ